MKPKSSLRSRVLASAVAGCVVAGLAVVLPLVHASVVLPSASVATLLIGTGVVPSTVAVAADLSFGITIGGGTGLTGTLTRDGQGWRVGDFLTAAGQTTPARLTQSLDDQGAAFIIDVDVDRNGSYANPGDLVSVTLVDGDGLPAPTASAVPTSSATPTGDASGSASPSTADPSATADPTASGSLDPDETPPGAAPTTSGPALTSPPSGDPSVTPPPDAGPSVSSGPPTTTGPTTTGPTTSGPTTTYGGSAPPSIATPSPTSPSSPTSPGPGESTTSPPGTGLPPVPPGGAACLPGQSPMAAQWPLIAAANALDEAALVAGRAGYAGITLDVPNCRVHLYWNGALPSNVAAVAAARSGTVVVHADAPHTNARLSYWADTLIDDPFRGRAAGVDVVSVSVPPEGTPVEVGVWPLPTVPPIDPATAVGRTQTMFDLLGIPTQVFAHRQTVPFGRWDDQTPFVAGARTRPVLPGGPCSTGWAVRDRGFRYVLTAAHCVRRPGEGPTHNGDRSRIVGYATDKEESMDYAILQMQTSDTNAAYTWDGPVHDANRDGVIDGAQALKPVDSRTATFKGQPLCSSGASTGVHCDLETEKPDTSFDTSMPDVRGVERTVTVRNAAVVKHTRGLIAGGRGDSGGPVFTLTSDHSKVVAVGILQGGVDDVANFLDCGTHPSSLCAKRIHVIRLEKILARLDRSFGAGADFEIVTR